MDACPVSLQLQLTPFLPYRENCRSGGEWNSASAKAGSRLRSSILYSADTGLTLPRDGVCYDEWIRRVVIGDDRHAE